MRLWVACDLHGIQWLYKDIKPELSEIGLWYNGIPDARLGKNFINNLKFGDEPIEFIRVI